MGTTKDNSFNVLITILILLFSIVVVQTISLYYQTQVLKYVNTPPPSPEILRELEEIHQRIHNEHQ